MKTSALRDCNNVDVVGREALALVAEKKKKTFIPKVSVNKTPARGRGMRT